MPGNETEYSKFGNDIVIEAKMKSALIANRTADIPAVEIPEKSVSLKLK